MSTTDYGTAPPPAPRPGRTNVLAIISLVAGIISLPLFCCWPISIPGGLAAIVLGAIAINQIKKTGEGGRGLAIGGIALGALAILLFVVLVAIGNVVDQDALQNWIEEQQGLQQPGDVIIEEDEELGPPEMIEEDGFDEPVTPDPVDSPEPAGDAPELGGTN